MKPLKENLLSCLVIVILANGALCKTIDGPEKENARPPEAIDTAEEEETKSPEKVEHKPVSYHAYKVLEAVPENNEQVTVLKELEKQSDAPGFEFWKVPHNVNDTCSLSVSPNLIEVMQTYLELKGIKHKVVVEDLQELIEKERNEILEADYDEDLEFRDPSLSHYSHENYNNLEQGTNSI